MTYTLEHQKHTDRTIAHWRDNDDGEGCQYTQITNGFVAFTHELPRERFVYLLHVCPPAEDGYMHYRFIREKRKCECGQIVPNQIRAVYKLIVLEV